MGETEMAEMNRASILTTVTHLLNLQRCLIMLRKMCARLSMISENLTSPRRRKTVIVLVSGNFVATFSRKMSYHNR
jgi:hypothetical protein